MTHSGSRLARCTRHPPRPPGAAIDFSRITTARVVPSGVEAPAPTPTLRAPLNHVAFSSSADPIQWDRLFSFLDISYSLRVFALVLEPMITIASFRPASETISPCFSVVGLHIVSNALRETDIFRAAAAFEAACPWAGKKPSLGKPQTP